MSVLGCAIPKEAWLHERAEMNGTAARSKAEGGDLAGSWEAWMRKIVEFEKLGDDWDGLGALAPARELIHSAVGLARLLAERGVEPPQTVVAGTDGSIDFGWQDASGGYAEIEIVRPFFAEVMVLEPGKPIKHWTLPTE